MGLVYLFTGEGGGKTTNALGLALRCLGHGKKVVIIQFLKWWKETGEWKFGYPGYLLFQFGKKGWKSRKELGEQDKTLAKAGLRLCEVYLKKRPAPDLIVLDELNLAIRERLLDVDKVLGILENIPEETTIVITGRDADPKLIARADVVNEIREVKSPKEMPLTEGIQY